MCVTYGSGVVDFLHVDNLVQAHVLAAQALTPQHRHVAVSRSHTQQEGNVLLNNTLNIFYLRLYGIRHIGKGPFR